VKLRRVRLPNGIAIWAPSRFEAAILYREIVTERTYEQHVTIGAGAVVFDVGANIGLFGMHLAGVAPGIQVHAFEPVPDLFEAAQRNLAEHAPTARVWNVGLADREDEAVFELDPFSTMTATMHPGILDEGASRGRAIGVWASAALADLDKVSPGRAVRLARAGLAHSATRPAVLAVLMPLALAVAARRRLFLRRRRCRLQTFSSALALAAVEAVDLVKIDVEGAEEQVLAGITARDWPRIRQLVIEVHDVDGRLARIARMLERGGYDVVHAREDWALHELFGISTVYAMRR
jgi:31-O-methyltransferase